MDDIRIRRNTRPGSICLSATDEQMETHRESMRSWGQGSTHIRLLPNRKNLLRIYYSNL
jgi:hypothetical protein